MYILFIHCLYILHCFVFLQTNYCFLITKVNSVFFFKATSEARCLIVCVGFFFRQNVTSLCICEGLGYFSPSLFLRDHPKSQKRSATECAFWPFKKVPKIFRLGDFISFESMIFAKIFRVFSDFA